MTGADSREIATWTLRAFLKALEEARGFLEGRDEPLIFRGFECRASEMAPAARLAAANNRTVLAWALWAQREDEIARGRVVPEPYVWNTRMRVFPDGDR
jgi:hypothetical protein